ncbi:HAMP domain-containing sensor histidine kinase [Cohnella abietis]|nr:HAMP domain-containing histidine kinase [Cohnella abietis]
MPVKLKLTLGSAVLLTMLFVGYNALQYVLMEKWMIQREKSNAQRNMNGILNYFLERESGFTQEQLPEIRHYLDKINRDDQRIRIMDAKGKPVITVTNNVSEQWVEPQPISRQEVFISRGGEHTLLVMRSPLTIFEFKGTIEIVKSMAEYEEWSAAISRFMVYFTLAAVVLSVLVGWLLSWRLLKPLQAMAQTIRNVKNKGLHERTKPPANGDEISTLMLLFNEMMDQVEEAFRQQSRFVEDASHELRTPIAIIEGHLALLQRWGKEHPAVLEESLQASLQEFTRLKGLVLELLALSRAEKNSLAPTPLLTDLDDHIRVMVKRVAPIYRGFQLVTKLEPLGGATVLISVEHLEQIMLIIIDNAVKYSLHNTTILISLMLRGEYVCLDITDYGIGIPAKDLPYVMDRFYRVDKARSRDMGGNGLGLAIAKRLVERYKGKLEIDSREAVGTTVSIILPISTDGEQRLEGAV